MFPLNRVGRGLKSDAPGTVHGPIEALPPDPTDLSHVDAERTRYGPVPIRDTIPKNTIYTTASLTSSPVRTPPPANNRWTPSGPSDTCNGARILASTIATNASA
jgi:hypothetical protein